MVSEEARFENAVYDAFQRDVSVDIFGGGKWWSTLHRIEVESGLDWKEVTKRMEKIREKLTVEINQAWYNAVDKVALPSEQGE